MPKKDLLKAVIEYTKVSLNHKPYDLTIYIVLIKVNLILKVWHQKGPKNSLWRNVIFLLYTLDWEKLPTKVEQFQD